MNKQLLINKWQTLDADDQEKVIAFIDLLQRKKADYQPKTELGKKLWELRLKSLGKQPLLNSWEEVEQELAQRRGGVRE